MPSRHLLQDVAILLASILVAVLIVQFEVVQFLLTQIQVQALLASFVAGMFFTSVVTTAPAMAVLGELSLQTHPILVAIFGGAGAVVGDYLLFMFVRDRITGDIAYLLSRTGTPRIFKIFRPKTFKRLLPFIGGLILASPLPDEVGLTLLGFSHMKNRRFILVSFTFNAIGILIIALVARWAVGV